MTAIEVDLVKRTEAYNQFKRVCKNAGVKMTESKLSSLASPTWNGRDAVMKWKQGKEQAGNDKRIRRAMEEVPAR